ncbi:uncharacterized protein LOC118430365 [Branchiostoma floridae]|uniref:Uncharacterized protein LOC118430365 n=1 Tax=Branchiostoma floridae TaxID=7739 RepID=A0A9J7MA51_BRAFL|nr:uncharacterized protein LOC118430365 [Branchiostoma floridae]
MFFTLTILVTLCDSVLGDGYMFTEEMYDKCWTEVYLSADRAGYITYHRAGPYPPYKECAVNYYTDSGYVISLEAFNLTGMPSDCSDYIFACNEKDFLCDTDSSSVHYCWRGVHYSHDVSWGQSITIRLFSDHSTQGVYSIEYRVEEAKTDSDTIVYIVVGVIAAVCVVVGIICKCCRNDDDDLPPLNIPPVTTRSPNASMLRNARPLIPERNSTEFVSPPGLVYIPPAGYPSAPAPGNLQWYDLQERSRAPLPPAGLGQEPPPPPYDEALQMPRKQPTTS